VVDGSAPDEQRESMGAAVDDVLSEIGAGESQRIVVLNKTDLLDGEERRRLELDHRGAVPVSALTGEGLEDLKRRIEAAFAGSLTPVDLLVPYDEGGVLSRLHELAADLERDDTAEGVRVKARVPPSVAERLRPFDVNGHHPADGDA
jgi:GTP-binding protein HflX